MYSLVRLHLLGRISIPSIIIILSIILSSQSVDLAFFLKLFIPFFQYSFPNCLSEEEREREYKFQ